MHKLHKAGKVDFSVDVSNGKVIGLNAAHPTKGNLQARKVKSRQKLADTQPPVIQTSMRMAQASAPLSVPTISAGLQSRSNVGVLHREAPACS
jgi:hypothetical protein